MKSTKTLIREVNLDKKLTDVEKKRRLEFLKISMEFEESHKRFQKILKQDPR